MQSALCSASIHYYKISKEKLKRDGCQSTEMGSNTTAAGGNWCCPAVKMSAWLLCFALPARTARKRLRCANILATRLCLYQPPHTLLCQPVQMHSSLTKWNGGGKIFLPSLLPLLAQPFQMERGVGGLGARTLFCASSLRGSSWSLPRLSVMLRRKGGRIRWNGSRNRAEEEEEEEDDEEEQV